MTGINIPEFMQPIKIDLEDSHMFVGVECKEEEYKELTKRFPLGAPITKAAVQEVLTGMRAIEMQAKTPEPQVADSVAATLAQRGSRYGDFTDHARLCQRLMADMQGFTKSRDLASGPADYKPWENLSDVQKQALTVIVDKIARILSGDPNYDDNWHDIQGYAKLVEDRLPCNVNKE